MQDGAEPAPDPQVQVYLGTWVSEEIVTLSEDPYGATLVSADLGGDVFIVFDGYGASDSGGTVIVKVGNIQKTIDVDPQTGKATVQ